MEAHYDIEPMNINSNIVLDVKSMAFYSHKDNVVIIIETTDDVIHGVELEIEEAGKMVGTLETAKKQAEAYEYSDEETN